MQWLRKLKIRAKLILLILLAGPIALVLAGAGFMAYHQLDQSQSRMAAAIALLAMVAEASSVWPEGELADIRRGLPSLLALDAVQTACLHDRNGSLLAQATRSNTSPVCPQSNASVVTTQPASQITSTRPVYLNGNHSGDLSVIVAQNGAISLDSLLLAGAALALLFLGLTGIIIYLFRMIDIPVTQLGGLARKIVTHNNFSVRAHHLHDDELGDIADAINIMLGKIEQDNEELTQLVYYDPLTNLANRRMFTERLLFALENARRSGDPMGLILLNLNTFKAVNDRLGQEAGDALLKQVARRVESALPETATAFRLGDDEFVVLQVGATQSLVTTTADRILQALVEPLTQTGQPLAISCSIGMVISDGSHTASTIMKNADTALCHARNAGGNASSLYQA